MYATIERTRTATAITPLTAGMTLDTLRILDAAAFAADLLAAKLTAAANLRTATTPRARRAADRAHDAAELAYGFARRDVEMAVRAANPGAVEAQIQRASRSL